YDDRKTAKEHQNGHSPQNEHINQNRQDAERSEGSKQYRECRHLSRQGSAQVFLQPFQSVYSFYAINQRLHKKYSQRRQKGKLKADIENEARIKQNHACAG